MLGGCLGFGEEEDEGRSARANGATFDVAEHQAFAEPRELRSRDGELAATLTVGAGPLEIGGEEVIGKSYDGSFPGPTMVVAPGDWIRLEFVNNLDEATNIHFHGFHTSPSGIADNVLRTIPAHSTAKVAVPVPRNMSPGVYWYHSHEHTLSEEQVFSGLSGAIVVQGVEDRLPAELRGIEQRVFALKDVQVKDGAILTKNIDSGAPTTRTVNGLVDPELEIAPGETQMWRFANIGADIWYRVYFGGRPFHVIAEDANPVGEVWRAKRLLLPPGKRYDVLVQGPKHGHHELETLAYSTGKAATATRGGPWRASLRPAIRSSPRRCRGAWDPSPTCPQARSTAGAISSSRRATTAIGSSSTESNSATTGSTSAPKSAKPRTG